MKRSNQPVVSVCDYDNDNGDGDRQGALSNRNSLPNSTHSHLTYHSKTASLHNAQQFTDTDLICNINTNTNSSETTVDTSTRNEPYSSDSVAESSTEMSSPIRPSQALNPTGYNSNFSYRMPISSFSDLESLMESHVKPNESLLREHQESVHEAILSAASFFGMSEFLQNRHPSTEGADKDIQNDLLDCRSIKSSIVSETRISHQLTSQYLTIPIADEKDHVEASGLIEIPYSGEKTRRKLSTASDSESTSFASSNCLIRQTKESSNSTGECVDPRDGHVWRSKYCILEGGVLYFYRNEKDADLPEAQRERKDAYSRLNNEFSSADNDQSPSSSRHGREYLSKSPLPRRTLTSYTPLLSDTALENAFPLFDSDDQIDLLDPGLPVWEKRVSMKNVATVRTTEDEYGENSFVLEAAQEDSTRISGVTDFLVLRTSSSSEMNEWLLKFNIVVRQMLSSVYDSRVCSKTYYGSINGKQLPFHPGSSLQYATISSSLNNHKNATSLERSRSVSPSLIPLSHGHGRNGLNRIRTKALQQYRQNSSSSVESSPRFSPCRPISSNPQGYTDLLPFRPKAWDQTPQVASPAGSVPSDHEHPQSGYITSYHSPSLPPTTSPVFEFSSPLPLSPLPLMPNLTYQLQDDKPTRNPGAYVPPHLKRKLAAAANVPIIAEADVSNTPMPAQISSMDSIQDIQGKIILGGCADPKFGSILDPVNIHGPKVRCSKNSNNTVAVGGYGGGDRCSSACPKYQKWEVGAVSECGIRESNEDAFLVAEDLCAACGSVESLDDTGPKIGLFAIFDGHCGSHASRFAAEKFSLHVINSLSELEADSQGFNEAEPSVLLQQALRNASATVDYEFCRISKSDGRDWDSGSTALIVLVRGNDVLFANLGDCRAVVCASGVGRPHLDAFSETDGWNCLEYDQSSSGSSHVQHEACFWKDVCEIHSPSHHEERHRIEAANGWITMEREICAAQLHRLEFTDDDVVEIMRRYFSDRIDEISADNTRTHQPRYRAAPGRMIEISRICGELAVSRAIGDRDFKAWFNRQSITDEGDHWWPGPDFLPYPLGHNESFKGDLVSAVPDIKIHTLKGNGVDAEFLILACDGLWDVMDPDDAVRITRSLLFEKKWKAKKAVSFCYCYHFIYSVSLSTAPTSIFCSST
jgi:serine/threonine protein phosphatase PrpC